MAMDNPLSTIVVLDEEPYCRYLPPNCSIEIGNIAEYPQNSRWDYLFVRNIRSVSNWGAYFDHLHGMLRPGGHIELVDIDDAYDVVCTCPQVGKWAKTNSSAGTSKGTSKGTRASAQANRCSACASFPSAKRRRDLLRESGFCKLTITYHARPWRVTDGAKLSR